MFGQFRCPCSCEVMEAGRSASLWHGKLGSGAPLRRNAGGFGLDGSTALESRSWGSALPLIPSAAPFAGVRPQAGSSPWVFPTGKLSPHLEHLGRACHSCTSHPQCLHSIRGYISPTGITLPTGRRAGLRGLAHGCRPPGGHREAAPNRAPCSGRWVPSGRSMDGPPIRTPGTRAVASGAQS